MPEIIQTEFIGQHHNNFSTSYFGINIIRKLINWKYYWPSFRKDAEAYIRGGNICLALKVV